MNRIIFFLILLLPFTIKAQTAAGNKLLETWDTHCSMNYFLLDSVPEKNLADTLCSGGRNVLQHFIHLNETRVMWLKQLTGADMKPYQLPKTAAHAEISSMLKKTDALVRDFLEKNETVAIKGFGGNTIAFMGYLIAHEAHSRGQIVVAYKQAGHPLPPKIQYGIWRWD